MVGKPDCEKPSRSPYGTDAKGGNFIILSSASGGEKGGVGGLVCGNEKISPVFGCGDALVSRAGGVSGGGFTENKNGGEVGSNGGGVAPSGEAFFPRDVGCGGGARGEKSLGGDSNAMAYGHSRITNEPRAGAGFAVDRE
jgi:hypothetical protein